jgi:hypothetical protein
MCGLLTGNSDRVEVEWKYILKLHPDESQRPRPSANAKPLPEHLKESDASLDITNRTDGVPDMGDPFHDPHSEQKWAEWHTAPEVTRSPAKIDFSKENRLWYYLGKPSTEARPQYTENPARRRNNPKSNFLDTVKPPPPPVPAFAQRSYPASYPIKPAPIAIPPRTPMQQQMQPASRPYNYKPKESYMTTWKSPVYNPDTRKNPNSPVAHQPNVSYDHRPPSQGYGQAYQGYHHHRAPSNAIPQPQPQQQQQQFQYLPYVPPQAHPSSNWKAQSATPGPMLNGIDQYAHPMQPQASHSQPYPSQPNNHSPRQLPPYPFSQSAGQNTRPNFSPSPYGAVSQAPSGRASVSNMLSNPTGTPKPPMYATTPSLPVVHAAQTPTEYLTYVMQYPYLKNAYLRRAKTYVSPYSSSGGFTESWMPKVSNPSTPTAIAPRPSGPNPQAYYHGQHPPPGLPAPKPTAQFQSSDAFQRDMARTAQPAEAPKWEQMLKQLATSTGPAALPTSMAGPPQAQQYRYPPPPSRSSMSYDIPRSMQAMQSHSPPLPPPRDLRRPTPSPISDDGKGVVAVPGAQGNPGLPPLQPAPQGHSGETWRYT